MAYSKQNFQNGQILNAANLEAMENGIIAGQGAENLLDNSNFRDPVNSRGKNTYSDAGNEYTIDRWKTQNNTNISIENGHINIIGQWELYQIIQNPKDGIYTFAARIRINSVGQFTPIMEVNNGSNTGRQISLDADIGEWKTYILQYDLSSMTAETIKFLLSPRGGNTTASISVEWAAMYKGAYTTNTLPAYVPKGKHVEMLNCGVSLQPHNLLDNSDFTNPVNQRGQTSYTGAGYTIDRWKAGVSDCSMYVNAGKSVAFNTKTEGVNAYWRQYLPHSLSQLEGETFTLAIKDAWGKIHCASGVYPTSAPSDTKSVIWINMYENVSIVLYCATDGTAFVQLTTKKSVPIVWVALYEGSYTTDTLPSYVPKGKHVEMLNCGVSFAPHNLLDNSDFTNPVNQRGATTTSQYKYFLDRWIARLSDISLAVGNSGLTLTSSATENIFIYQKLSAGKALNGKTVTVAVCDGTGNVATTTTNLPTTNATSWTSYAVAQTNNGVYASVIDLGSGDYPIAVRVGVQSGALNKTIRWAALYEGSYDASTLPAYQPKGYAAELAECQRYYWQY